MAAFSMRIVVADYYTAKPISPLDYDFSEFRSSPIERVPIIRIFGSTPKGQKACLHIHDVYPYFYVPLPENIADEKNFCLEFASSLDTSLHVALGKAVSSQQYVYSVSVEKKIPFYGYYEGKKKFMKISMYNPNLVSRAGELLISGAVLNQTFQPYETHIPYMLQFLIDYNLSGMNFIHLSNIEFRQPLPPADENSPKNPFRSPLHSPLGSPIFSQINSNKSTVPNFLLLTPDIEKQTTCPLEGDTIARNIKNKDFIQESLGKNPGLALLWEDEKMRRRENNESSFIEMPVSQPRDRYKKTDLEELQLQRLKNLLDENKLQQSGKLDESDATSFNLPPAVVSEHSRDDLSSSVDPSLIDILADMPNDSIVNTPLSETTFINNGLFDEQDGNEVEQEEERESIMMSQKLPKIGDDDDDDRITNNDESTEDEDEESVWTDTFLAQIPQLDGHSDENSSTLQHFDDYTEQPHSKSVSLPTDTSTNKFDSSELTRIPQIDGNYSSESSTDDFQIPSRKKTKKRKSWQRKSSNFIDDELESNSSSTKSENKNSNSDASSVQSSDIYHPLSIEAVQTFSVSPIEGRKMYPTRHSTLNKTTIQKPTSICSKHSRHNEKITKYRKKHGKLPLTFLSQPVLDKKSETKLNRTTSNSSMISPSPRDQKLILETKTDRKSYHQKYQIKQFAIVLKDILKDKSTTGLEKCISDKQKQSQSEDTCSQKENKESLSEIISSENNETGSSILPKPQLPSPFKYSQQSRRPSLFSGKPMKFILSGKASLKRILDASSTPNNEDAKRLKSFENVSGSGSATNTINKEISVSPKDPSAPSTFRDVLSSVEKVTLLSPVKNPETPQTIYDSFENSNLILSSQSSNQNKSFCSVKTQDIEKTVRLPTSSSHIKNVNLNKDFVTPISKRLPKKSIDYNIVSLKENFGRQTQTVDCESSEQISKVLPPDQSESKKACSIGDENISNVNNKSLLHEETPSQNLIPQLTVNIQQTSMQGPVDTVSSGDSFHNGQDTNVCMQSDILFSQTNTEAQLFRNINTSQLDYECNTLQNSLSPGNEESQVFDKPAGKSLVASQNTTSAETKQKSCFIKPVFDPPTVENVLQSLHKYSMDECKYVAPFYSIEKDAASTSAVHSGQIVAKAANKTKNLPEASTKYSGALSKLQKNQINNMDISLVPDLVISPENLKTSDIKHLLYGEQYINIIPVKQPPSSIEVLAWYEKEKVKESKNKQQKNEAPTKSSKVVKQAKAEIDQSSSTACKKTSRKHVAINPTLSSLLQTIEKETTKERMTEDSTVVSTISPPFRKPAASAVRTLKSMKQKQVNKLTLDMSAIEGMSPNNTYAFKFPSQKMSDVKALHLEQHLTILSIEVHVNTRRDYKPDPSIDSISAIFFYFCKDPSATNLEKTSDAGVFVFGDGLQSSLEKGTLRKQMMYRAGLSNIKCVCFDEEVKMLLDFALFVQNIDPDVIMGYEVQMLSLGYIIERAAVLEINMTHKLSRLIDMYNKVPSKNEKTDENWFGQLVTMSIPGRIILNIWRVMRSEVTLQIYTYENVLYHVLHRRVAKHSYKLLSNLWNENHNRWRVFEYYMERCKGNVELLDQIDFINRTSELARIFGILFYSVISRGSQYRVESMMLRIAKPLDFVPVSPNVHQRAKMAAPECIQLVLEPESKMYVDPVIVLDFQSLYPSIIIAYNYCYSTCLGRVQQFGQNEHFSFGATNLNLPFQTTNELLNNENIHISPNGVGFVTTSVRKGILPRMLEEILNTRLMVKGAMKKAKQDKVLHKMLDSRQLGLKLIANVTYGYTAANFSGRMPCIEIGDSVVRKGRETLERAIELVNTTSKWNAKVVYGDTDSLFVLLKGASKETAFDIAKEIVDEVTALNPKPIKLKFEKVYQPCVLITKKRYVGYMYETRDQKHPVFDAKGIETIRRDNCPAVGKILDKSLRVLFDTKDVSLVKAYVQNQFNKITQGRVTMKDFIFAKEYRGMSSYKPGACVPALMLTRKFLKIDRRAEPRIGERVPYVIVHGNPKLPLIQLVRTPHEVADTPGLRINDIYYITKQICPALGRVFSLLGVNVQQWFAEMPKVSRVQQRELEVDGKRKGTISHYFASSHCPVCESVTTKKLCNECVLKPQETVLSLSFRISTTERRFNNLIKLCQHCTGCQDTDAIKCISLDCPNFFKLSNIKRDMSRLHVTRTIIEEMF